jgi:hypothetical protein
MQYRFGADALTEAIVANIERGRAVETPFFHLRFERVFPDDVYADMMTAMPGATDYRPELGRSRDNVREDGAVTRAKIDLFPEHIRHFPAAQRPLWSAVGTALRSAAVRDAFMRRLVPGLKRRFGAKASAVRLYPIPVLTRDTTGYAIPPHTDTHWKGITVQLYLPRDASATHIGTVFHDRTADGAMPRACRMTFAPNSGYAFAVADNTWHSADEVGPEIASRDSILLTYYVDGGALLTVRNRAKRLGNLLRAEAKYAFQRLTARPSRAWSEGRSEPRNAP